MGRKIPGKKHRTIKDPYKQRQKRLESLKLKVNNPPLNSDEQHIPKSLLRIMELKEKVKQQKLKKPSKNVTAQTKKKKSRAKDRNKKLILPSVRKFLDKMPKLPGMTKPDTYIPNLTQKPNESVQNFIHRVDIMTQNLINETEFEKKFGVTIAKDPKTGKILEVKQIKKKNSKSKKKKLTEKRKEKLALKKSVENNVKDFHQLKDNVEFGETVHRPPSLPILKNSHKAAEKNSKPRYSNLLLNRVIDDKQTKTARNICDLSKEKMEKERQFIVEAYRKTKKKMNKV